MSKTQNIYVRNLIRACTTLQGQMSALVNEILFDDLESLVQNQCKVRIQGDIQRYIQEVESILERKQGSAANLSVHSRRAYQWLKYLSVEKYIRQHIWTLRSLYRLNAKISTSCSKKQLTAQISLYHIGALYKMQEKDSILKITAHEAFIAAPQKVLEALINIAYHKNKSSAAVIIKKFADSEELFAIQQEMEYMGIPQGANAQGEHYNLEEVFERVNQTYFRNELAQPHLIWNQQLTYRKFGHYQYSTDTVMVSRSLDLPDTPAFALDFVMYHELLHKILGYKLVNGRRYAHTSTFREEERKFNKYKKVQDYLKKLSKSIS